MTLSIYIPVLKRDALLERCLASIQRSIPDSFTEGADYEIVIIEGVSPLSKARNEGIRRSSGRWIACVDGDDEVAEAWFASIWRAIAEAEQRSDIDDIVFDMVVMGPERHYTARYGREHVIESKILVDDMLRDLRIENHAMRHVMRRSLLAGLPFAHEPLMEDYLTLPGVLKNARRVLYLDEPLYHYVVRSGSLSAKASGLEVFNIGMRRATQYGGAAIIGASRLAYECLYRRVDFSSVARHWLRRHIVSELTDRDVGWKWKLKFLLASLGVVIRRPCI